MCNLFKKCIHLLLIVLNVYTSTSSNITIKDLDVICGVHDESMMSSPPPQCTALAVYSKFIDELETLSESKGALPLLIIMESIDFGKVGELIEEDMGDVLADFTHIEFDYMVFDNSYKYLDISGSTSDTQYSQSIGKFLDKARERFPGKGFGLVLGHDVHSMEDKIDLTILSDYSDLYLLESTGYRECHYHTHQKDMNVLATKDDILGSFEELRKLEVPFDKLIYTIELKIESRKTISSKDLDYSYLCGHKLSNHRKYCFNTVQNIFEKARLRISEGTAGIFINGVQFDDVDGTCGCKTPNDKDACFRGLKTIARASQEDKNDLSFYDCCEGAYPVIQ